MQEQSDNEIAAAVEMAEMRKDIEYIKEQVKAINDKLDKQYVTRTEFEPVKRIVYGCVVLILTAVVGALIGLVVLR